MVSDAGVIVASMVASISLMTVVAIWALLGREITIARALALGLAMVVGAIGTGVFSHDRVFWISVILVAQALAVGAILCIRAERFRFVRS